MLAVEQRAKVQDSFWEWGNHIFFILGNWETILFILGEQGYHPGKAFINVLILVKILAYASVSLHGRMPMEKRVVRLCWGYRCSRGSKFE